MSTFGTKNTLTYAELSTILAALRYWQEHTAEEERTVDDYPHFHSVKALDDPEIDDLCERLNTRQIVTITGGPLA